MRSVTILVFVEPGMAAMLRTQNQKRKTLN